MNANRIKKAILHSLIALVIFFIPLCPIPFIEPVHNGTDANIYSPLVNSYMNALLFFGGVIWGRLALKLSTIFLKDLLTKDEEDER
jgi:hypothetical protein